MLWMRKKVRKSDQDNILDASSKEGNLALSTFIPV